MRTIEGRYTLGLLLLTASTGAVDAVSYLALDRVFTGNMTGNVLFLGFAIVGVAGIPFLNNLIALLGFVAGSIVSSRIVGHRHERQLPLRSAWTLAGSGLLGIGLVAVWLAVGQLPHPVLLVVTFLLAAVMGAQATAVKPIGNSDVTTIVVTSTLANLARDSRLAGGHGQHWVRRLLAILAMGLGAALGAGVLALWGGPLALAAAILLFALGVTTLLVARGMAEASRPSGAEVPHVG